MEDILDFFLRKLIEVGALVAVQAASLLMVRYLSRRGAVGATGRAGAGWRAGSVAGPGSVVAGGQQRGHGEGQGHPCGDGDGSPGSDEIMVVVTDPEGRDTVLDLDVCN